MRIYLIGYMGSGKTSVGKKLAKNIGYNFIDLDKLIEKNYHKNITEIFEKEGENNFREIERFYLFKTIEWSKAIISCGGGTPCFFENMDWMNKNGKTLYLKHSANTLYNRLINSDTERPLLKGLFGEKLKNYISESLKEREKFYLKAHHTVNGINININDIIQQIQLR